jgi:hypothetical protein
MSFFRKLFTRNITYLEKVIRDRNHTDLLHVFGAIRIMPEEGDSFDIYRYCIIHLDTYEVTNGLEQTGNEFDVNSVYAQRAIDAMSLVLNRKLLPVIVSDPDDNDNGNEEDEEVTESATFINLDNNCEFPVVERKATDSDTALPRKLPADCLIFTEHKTNDQDWFTVELMRNGQSRNVHRLRGMHDYFRYVIYLKSTNRILCTYRMESWFGSGGMAFFVLDATSGELLINKLLK